MNHALHLYKLKQRTIPKELSFNGAELTDYSSLLFSFTDKNEVGDLQRL